jgi:peptide deformylase
VTDEPDARALTDLVERLVAAPGPAPIVQAGHPVLRRPARPYDGQLDDVLLGELLDLMRRTMHAAPGVGLAAPQIGVPLAIAVLEDPGARDDEVRDLRERPPLPYRVLVNPRYAGVGDETAEFYEGCLSVRGWQAVVARHRSVHLTGQDEAGRPLDEVVTGWPARIVQHETDHLAGTLYVDRARMRSLVGDSGVGAALAAESSPTTAARVLGFPLG